MVQTTKLKLGWTLAKQILVSDQTLLLLRQEDYTPFADKKQTKFGLDDNSEPKEIPRATIKAILLSLTDGVVKVITENNIIDIKKLFACC